VTKKKTPKSPTQKNREARAAYAVWLRLTEEERIASGIPNKTQFAKRYGMSREILWHWEKNPDFQKVVSGEVETEDDKEKQEWDLICGSFAYFVDTYGTMWKKEGGDAIPFKLWDFQRDAAQHMQQDIQLIILKARQMGLSWLSSAYALWKMMTTANFHVYYISLGRVEVEEQFERIRFIFMNLPDWMQEKAVLGGKGCKDNTFIIEFTNGSAIHSVASGRRSGHGAAPGLIIADEWARVQEAVSKWRALKPAAGASTQIFMVSTSDGFGNHFADMWFDAKAGKNGFVPIFYSWKQHPEYTEEYIEHQRRDFAGDMRGFKEAFPSVPEDAFMAASRAVFDFGRIKELKEYIRNKDIEPRIGMVQLEEGGERKFKETDDGMLQVWKEPEVGHRYACGADVAEGLVDGDWSAACIIDCDSNELVALFHGKIPIEYYAYPLEQVCRWYNNAFLAVEANHNSELILTDLKQVYPFLYMRPQKQNITDLPTMVPGFYTTGTSKPRIIGQLRRAFADMDTVLWIYSDTVLDEMSVYEQQDNQKLEARKGYNDDCVMALAIAYEAAVTIPYRTDTWDMPQEEHRNWLSL